MADEDAMKLREVPIGKHTDPDILALLDELADAAGIEWHSMSSQAFIPFLILCMHPQGGGTRRASRCTHPGRGIPISITSAEGRETARLPVFEWMR